MTWTWTLGHRLKVERRSKSSESFFVGFYWHNKMIPAPLSLLLWCILVLLVPRLLTKIKKKVQWAAALWRMCPFSLYWCDTSGWDALNSWTNYCRLQQTVQSAGDGIQINLILMTTVWVLLHSVLLFNNAEVTSICFISKVWQHPLWKDYNTVSYPPCCLDIFE